MGRRRSSPINIVLGWIEKLSIKVRVGLGVVSGICGLIAIWYFVRDFHKLFVASEASHAIGLGVLVYKLTTKKTCSGLSLRMQELTAIYLATRVYCGFLMRGDIHTWLDLTTLIPTLWVIYMIRFKLNSTYIKELDNIPIYYLIIPAAILAVLVYPYAFYHFTSRILWAFSNYLEAVAVVPQLRLMQNAKMVEPFTGHYVFALGVSRFFGCAYWIIQLIRTRGRYLFFAGAFWIPMLIISEIIQTFILIDFCYYYVKSVLDGKLLVRLPSPV